MEKQSSSARERLLPEVTFGIAIMRGVSALGIGLLLFFFPDKSGKILVNMMGFFWLITGISLLRRDADDPVIKMVGKRTARLIAIVGAVAGLFVVTRGISRQIVPEGAYFALLGVVILLTGLVHLSADVRFGGAVSAQHRWLGILLGIFEFGLGLTLIVSPLDRSPITYWIATIWALVFGALVIIDAFTQRSQARRDTATASATEAAPAKIETTDPLP